MGLKKCKLMDLKEITNSNQKLIIQNLLTKMKEPVQEKRTINIKMSYRNSLLVKMMRVVT